MKVRPVSITAPLPGAVVGLPVDANPEALMVYTARVSSPQNQDRHDTGAKLLRYCIQHGHWSVFEMVDLTVEIETSRAIAAQILRHRSFSFQEFSQRYSDVSKLGDDLFEVPELRARHVEGNRQGSGGDASQLPVHWEVPRSIWQRAVEWVSGLWPFVSSTIPQSRTEIRTAESVFREALDHSARAYSSLIAAGVAPESARFVLPLCTKTRLYMKGSVRSWIHYLNVRTDGHAQKEHRLVAEAVRGHFVVHFPVIAEAMGWDAPNQPPENQPTA